MTLSRLVPIKILESIDISGHTYPHSHQEHIDMLIVSVSSQSRFSLVSVSSQSHLSLVSVSSQSRLSLVSLSSHSHLRLVSVSSQSHFSLVSVSPLSWLSLVSSFRLLRPPSLMLWLCKMPAFSFLSFVNNYVSHFC
jgi:hypothetical protein